MIRKSNHGGAFFTHLFVLFFLTVVAQLANIAYESFQNTEPFLPKLLPSMLFLTILTIPSLIIGLTIGRDLGLGIFKSNSSGQIEPLKHKLLVSIISGIILGLLLLGMREALLSYLPDNIPQFGFRGFVGGILVSLGGAVGEEVWFRFGLMTLMLWLVKKVLKLNHLSNKVVFAVIIVSGVLFGMAHLPQLASFDSATQFAVWATILGNLVASILYGWCFWRHGLFYAIIAHFSLDLVLHAFPALF
jgi:hypothetical protein